jgi:GxxExxY protein
MLLQAEITEQIIGSFFVVYRHFGFGFLESVYKTAMAIELSFRGIEVKREVPVEVQYRGVVAGIYRIDMLVAQSVIVEVKSSLAITEANECQLLNYLKATDIEVGFLFNFGPDPKFRRRVYSNNRGHIITK